jgi:hypothetical protein
MSFRRHGCGGEEGGGRHRRMQKCFCVHKERLFGVDVGGGKEEEDKHQVQEFYFKFVGANLCTMLFQIAEILHD